MSKNKDTNAALQEITLSSKDLMNVIQASLATPMDGYPGKDALWGAPLLIEGEPGIAKTARIKQVTSALKAELFVFFAAPHPPESFGGALVPDGKGGAANVVALSELRRCIDRKTGVLFLDEVNAAAPATQGALQSLIHERRSGDAHIPNEIRILAAQNPEEIATGGFRLSPAVANRFVHLQDPGPTAEEWIKWSTGGSTWTTEHTLESLVDKVTAEWPSIWPQAQGLFAGFIQAKPDLLHVRPDISDPRSAKGWPSHRTWDFARRIWATNLILGTTDDVREAMVAGAVGVGASDALAEYARSADIPSPMDLLNNKWAINVDRLDVVLAAYSAATSYVVQRPTVQERQDLAPLMWKTLEKLFQLRLSDLVMSPVEQLLDANLGRNSKIPAIIAAASPVLVNIDHAGLSDLKKEMAK